MNGRYEVSNKKLVTPQFERTFDHEIHEVIYYKNIYVVLLTIPNDCNEVDNIYGINSVGKQIWRIENPEKVFNIQKTGKSEFDNMTLSIYVGLNQDDDVFSATTFFGIKYIFDYQNGKLLEKKNIRW